MPDTMLTWELSHAGDWRRLAVLVHQYDKQLDAIHVSAALVRLAKLHRSDASALTLPAGAAAAPAVGGGGGCPGRSRARFATARSRARARARARALVAADPDRPVWLTDAAERRLRRSVVQRHPGGAAAPQRTAPPARAAAAGNGGTERLSTPPPPLGPTAAHPVAHPDVARLLDSLLARIPGLMPRASYRTVSNMLWALGVLHPLTAQRRRRWGGVTAAGGGVARAAAAGAVLAAKMRHFWRDAGPQSLSLALWGLARLGLRPGPVWVAEFEAASGRLLHRFNARELSCSLWALATMRLRPDALWLAAAQRALAASLAADGGSAAAANTPVPAANLRSLATLLWAFAVLQVQLDGVVAAAVTAALTTRLRAERATAGPQALSMALWGCARLGLRPSGQLLVAWRRAASGPTLAAAPARAVACMLWSLARLRAAPPGAWADGAVAVLLARLSEGRLGRQALLLSVGALAQLDARVTPEWTRAFTAAAAPLMQKLDPSELGVVLHGLGRLVDGSGSGINSRGGAAATDVAAEFLAAADAAAAAALPAASADDLAGIGGGLTALGAARSPALHHALVRQASDLVRHGRLEPRHAASCLEFLAASARPTARCPAAASAAASRGGAGSDARTGCCGGGDGAGVVVDDGAGSRELCYDAVRARVPADTKQPLPPPQPPPPPPPRGLVAALLRIILKADLDRTDIFDLGQALCAAAELRCVAATPGARAAVVAAAARVSSAAPGARASLRLLQGMYGLRVRPRGAWLIRLASQIGGRLKALTGEELELLLRLLGALQCRPQPTSPPPPPGPDIPNGSSKSVAQQQQEAVSALSALLTAAQPALAAAPIQHLLQLTAAIVASTTGAPAVAASPPPPSPPSVTQLTLPPGWMAALEAATIGKLSQSCVSASALVELLACFAILGHAPGADWTAAWYECTARRLRSLSPAHLCTALHLQRRLGLRPPVEWLCSQAASLMAAAAPSAPPGEEQEPLHRRRQPLPPLEVLAAVAELQRRGLDDAGLVGSTAPPPASLSGLVATAATALHGEMRAADPAAQLATLAALQAIADPRVAAPAPHAEGWVVGVLAMAHSVIAERPLHQLLAALRSSTSAAAVVAAAPAAAAVSPEPLVMLLASMARWGHAPDHRWLSGIARHVCRQAESGAAAGGGGGAAGSGIAGGAGGWSAADAARAVCCLAALGYVPDAAVAERLQRLLQPSLAAPAGIDGNGGGLPPALAAELCAAWAAMRRRPPPGWWRAAEAGALATAALVEVPPATLIRLPYSMAQLGHVPSHEWLSSYLPYLTAALPSFALTHLSTSPTTATARAADLANLAWALGSAVHAGGYPTDVLYSSGALQALLIASAPLLGCMGPGQLVLLVEGLARGRHRLPPEWVDAFAGQVARQLSACGPSDLISFLYCLAFLDARPPAPWLAATLHRTAQLLPPLLRSPEAYRADDLAWAVAKLDRRGAIAQPFLELLRRQRAAAAAAVVAAAAAAPPPPPAWFMHAAGGQQQGFGAASAAAAEADGEARGGSAAAARGGRGRRSRCVDRRRGGSVSDAVAAVKSEASVGEAAEEGDEDVEESAAARGSRTGARRGRSGRGVASGSRGARTFRLSPSRSA